MNPIATMSQIAQYYPGTLSKEIQEKSSRFIKLIPSPVKEESGIQNQTIFSIAALTYLIPFQQPYAFLKSCVGLFEIPTVWTQAALCSIQVQMLTLIEPIFHEEMSPEKVLGLKTICSDPVKSYTYQLELDDVLLNWIHQNNPRTFFLSGFFTKIKPVLAIPECSVVNELFKLSPTITSKDIVSLSKEWTAETCIHWEKWAQEYMLPLLWTGMTIGTAIHLGVVYRRFMKNKEKELTIENSENKETLKLKREAYILKNTLHHLQSTEEKIAKLKLMDLTTKICWEFKIASGQIKIIDSSQENLKKIHCLFAGYLFQKCRPIDTLDLSVMFTMSPDNKTQIPTIMDTLDHHLRVLRDSILKTFIKTRCINMEFPDSRINDKHREEFAALSEKQEEQTYLTPAENKTLLEKLCLSHKLSKEDLKEIPAFIVGSYQNL